MGLLLQFRKLFFEYDTIRYVRIENKVIGIISWLYQLLVICYILCYVIYWEKGYQNTCKVSSTVTTKIKGVAFSHLPNKINDIQTDNIYMRIWDTIDVVFPSSGKNKGEFFIATNIIITQNQTQGKCSEDPNIKGAKCEENDDCKYGDSARKGNGVFTGICLKNPTAQAKNSTCEIFAWCPLENAIERDKPLLNDLGKFTVLIKNTISFDQFGMEYFRRNILEDNTETYLKNCIYDPKNHPFCPIFRIKDIINEAGWSYDEIGLKGAVFEINIDWNCNLDFNFLKYCLPKYTFSRIDNPNATLAPGWNIRYANYHEYDRRTLYKMYGIKFFIDVNGEGRKFGFLPLLLNLGSGLALLGFGSVICDLILMYSFKGNNSLKNKKYENVSVANANTVSASISMNANVQNNEDQ